MGKIGRSWGWGLASGAFGLGLIAVLGAPWPADGVAAAAPVAGAPTISPDPAVSPDQAVSPDRPAPGFSLRCRQEVAEPGFVLLGSDQLSSAAHSATRAGIACEMHPATG